MPRVSVVLVHGAIVNGSEMILLRMRLRRAGYVVRQFGYRSMRRGLAENAALLGEFLKQTPGEILHVVGHSMGGVLIRRVFETEPDPRPGRLVAIGSPFTDCWVARRVVGFHRNGHWMTGQTARDHILEPCDPVWRGSRDLGVLAGTYPLGVGSFIAGLPRPNDGVVRWEETRLQGITDHITFATYHFGMLLSRDCAGQIIHFLEHGKFARRGCASVDAVREQASEGHRAPLQY